MQPLRAEPVGQLFHVRVGGHRRKREWPGARRIGRIDPGGAVDEVEPLRAIVIWRQVLIADRPAGRDTSGMLDFAKIVDAEPRQRRPEEFGVSANEIVNTRRKPPPLGVAPLFPRLVAVLNEDRFRAPVLGLVGQEVAPFDQQDARAGVSERPRQSSAAHSRADDDYVVFD